MGNQACSSLSGMVGRQTSYDDGPLPQQQYVPYAQGYAGGAGGPQGVPVAQPVPVAQALPMGQAMPVGQAVPMGQAMPVGQAVPMGQAMPVAQAMPVGQPMAWQRNMPVAEGIPVQGVPVAGPVVGQAVAGVPVAQAHAAGRPRTSSVQFSESPVQLRAECAGRRRSLLVGINYFGTSSELSGCINDVMRLRPVLHELGFPSDPQQQLVLMDDGQHQAPTKANMIAGMRWLTSGVQTGDALFFHYSGHGGRQSDPSSSDGYNETLCPVDCDEVGQLLDTEIFELLVRPLPSGVKMTCIMDCCHSGGVLNLPYLFTGTAENLSNAMAGRAAEMVMGRNWARDLQQWREGNPMAMLSDVASMGLDLWSLRQEYLAAQQADGTGFATQEAQNAGLHVGEVVCFTGCRSDQTSADVGNVDGQFHLQPVGGSGSMIVDQARVGAAGGALTTVFIESLQTMQAGQLSYLQLLEHMRQRLAKEGFTQVPQLGTSLLIELQQPFSVDKITLPPQQALQGGAKAPASGGARGFMSTLNSQPQGQSMIQGSTASDGSNPYFTLLADGGAQLAELLISSMNDEPPADRAYHDSPSDRAYGDDGSAGFGGFGGMFGGLGAAIGEFAASAEEDLGEVFGEPVVVEEEDYGDDLDDSAACANDDFEEDFCESAEDD